MWVVGLVVGCELYVVSSSGSLQKTRCSKFVTSDYYAHSLRLY